MTQPQRSPILSRAEAARRLHRMAIEVAERNTAEQSLVVAGVEGYGMVVARRLMEELAGVVQMELELVTIQLDKKAPGEVRVTPAQDFTGKTILVVDDVADTGRTLLYALKPFLAHRPKSIQTLVLVERSHKLFPVNTDYVGLSLSTTLQEHIRVETDGEEIAGAYLM